MRLSYFLVIYLFLLNGCTEPSTDNAQEPIKQTQSEVITIGPKQKPLTVFLVRHAEKEDWSEDPDLSEAGYKRAALLAELLADKNIQYIHSSDYRRTRETARPAAEAFGLEIQLYLTDSMVSFIRQIKLMGGNHLIIGHSNSTPHMVKILGGNPGKKIEKHEYNRLYYVRLDSTANLKLELRTYGEGYWKK